MITIGAILALLLFTAPAMAVDAWDRTDYTLLGTMTAVQVVDWRQTRRILEQPDRYHEVNPILGRNPDRGSVDLYFAVSWLLKAGIAHVLPSQWRKVWLGGMAVGSLGLVIHNNNIGLGVRW